MSKLAIDGGSPVRSDPMPPRIQMNADELDVVVDLIRRSTTGGITLDRYGGEHVDAYEQEFAAYFGTKFATAVSSGTGAIHTALGALLLDIGGEVISSPITDPGAVAPILFQNCIPVFADCDPDTFNMDPASVAERISDKTVAIIAGHIAGQPCDLDPIMEIGREHKIPVIEDVSQSHDAEYKGRKCGSIGDMGAFSLMCGKHSTAGGQGGMVTMNDEQLYWDAKRFADRGKPFNSDEPGNLFLGLNYRMTELEAAIGRVQLTKLADIIARRRDAVAKLKAAFADLKSVRFYKEIDGAKSAYWFCLIHVDTAKLKVTKAEFAAALAAEGMPVGAGYDHLVYEKKWIRDRQTYGASQCPWCCPFYGREISYEGTCPNARVAIDAHMTLHVHECWTDREVANAAEAFAKVEAEYLR